MIKTQELFEHLNDGIKSSSRPDVLVNCATRDMTNEELTAISNSLPTHSYIISITDRAIARNNYKDSLSSSIYKRNHSVSELLLWYNNKKSGKVVLARKELQERFLYLSYDEQLEVMRTFLRSHKTDLAWCYKILRKWWSEELLSQVIDLWDASHDECCGWLVTRYASISQLRERVDSLSYDSNYFRLCKRLASESWFAIDKEKLRNVLDDDPDVKYLWIMSQTQEGLSSSDAWTIVYRRIAKTVIAAESKTDPNFHFILDGCIKLVDLKIYSTAESIFYITYLDGMDKMLYSLIQMGLFKEVYDFLEWDEIIHRQFISEFGEIETNSSHIMDEQILGYYKKYVKIVANHFPKEYSYLLEAEHNKQEIHNDLLFQDFNGQLKACPTDDDFTNETGYDLRGLSEEQKDVYYKEYIEKHSKISPKEETDEKNLQNWNRIMEENTSIAALKDFFGLVPIESEQESIVQNDETDCPTKDHKRNEFYQEEAPF